MGLNLIDSFRLKIETLFHLISKIINFCCSFHLFPYSQMKPHSLFNVKSMLHTLETQFFWTYFFIVRQPGWLAAFHSLFYPFTNYSKFYQMANYSIPINASRKTAIFNFLSWFCSIGYILQCKFLVLILLFRDWSRTDWCWLF